MNESALNALRRIVAFSAVVEIVAYSAETGQSFQRKLDT